MSRCVVLVISLPEDPVAADGERLLTARGHQVVRFDATRFPDDCALDLTWTPGGPRTRAFRAGESWIDLDGVDAVWHRRARTGRPKAARNAAMRTFANSESEATLLQLWRDLRAPFVPAPLPVIRAGQDKLRQLSLAASLGFEIPATCVTNDPDRLLGFYREHDGRIITKLIEHESMNRSGLSDQLIRFTERVTPGDLAAVRAVALCPVLAQAYVSKRVELRVTVVGERVFAAEIHSQAANRTRDDWRKYDNSHAPYLVHALPEDVAARCRALTAALDLRYGAVDLILTPDDRYVFLEINPAGEFHWIERRTGMPITDAVVDLLVELATDYRRGRDDPRAVPARC